VRPRTTALLLLALAVTGILVACSRGGDAIDFARTEDQVTSALAPPADGVLRMAVAPVLSPVPTFGLYEELANYLADKLGRPVQLIQGKTYQEINDLVKSGEASLGIVCTGAYLEGRDDFGMEAIVVPELDGGPYYFSLLIAREGLGVASLEDLRGRSFAFSDPLSNSGRLVPVYKLALLGESPDTFFSRTVYTYAHDNSIRAVAEGVVDGAAVDSLVFDYLAATEPQLAEQVQVVERWGPYGINPVVVNPLLDQTAKEALRSVFLGMDEDPEGRVLLRRLVIERFILPDERLYDSVVEMRAYLRERGLAP